MAEILSLVRNGLYFLTEHADDEAQADHLDIYVFPAKKSFFNAKAQSRQDVYSKKLSILC